MIPVTISKTLLVESVEELIPELHPYINDLPCSICHDPVGVDRPMGIVYGRYPNSKYARYFRSCHKCTQSIQDQLCAAQSEMVQ